jgi:beta-galactosidase
MLFGAAYYPEYQPYGRLERDVELMREAGFSFVRLGESTWSSWEPADGQFEFEVMDKAVETLADAGIGVILGTPTYAIPPWLHRRYPEMMAVRAGGAVVGYGGRQNVDITHAAYRFHAERIIRAVVGHYAGHRGIIGFQVDNEAGLELPHNRSIVEQFRDWLRDTYGSVAVLNDVWGLTYWSHRLGSWEDLWAPDGNTSPGYALAWRRFQATTVSEFLAWQAGIVREYVHPAQFITHCAAGGHGRPAADRYRIAQALDISAENVYYPMQEAFALPAVPGAELSAPEWAGAVASGPASLFFQADMGRSATGSGFLVTETNATSIGGAHTNYPAYDGQWRLAVYSMIARGAKAVGFWHWHTLHYGHEMYWGGVLGHDLEPGRCYGEIARIGAELLALDENLTDLIPDAGVAMLYSTDSRWSFEFQPPLPLVDSTMPDPNSYPRIFDTFYRALFDARVPVSIVHASSVTRVEDLARYPAVVVPALYVADQLLLRRLSAYAENGGHLVVSFRTGYADEHGRARWERAPGPLRPAVGASYQEYTNLVTPVVVRAAAGSPLTVPAGSAAQAWADCLELEGAQALASYDHPHLGRYAAITTHEHGRGRVTYVGTLPNAQLGRALAEWIAADSGLASIWPAMPDAVRVSGARTWTGEQLWFVGNWSWQATTITLPRDGRDLHSGVEIPAGGELAVDAWDVRLIQETGQQQGRGRHEDHD